MQLVPTLVYICIQILIDLANNKEMHSVFCFASRINNRKNGLCGLIK